MSEIRCTVKEAIEKLSHMNENDEVIITINNKVTHQHAKAQRIKKKKGEELIINANGILYQDNEYFGRLSLYGVLKNKDIIHNILFPQLEW